MKALSIAVFLLLIFHVSALMFFNRYRLKKTIEFLDKFLAKGWLTERDYDQLVGRYTGIFKNLEWFPEQSEYSNLYIDSSFLDFKNRSRTVIRYLLVSVPVLMLLNFFVIKWAES